MATEAREKVRKYAAASLHYIDNAKKMLLENEPGKASELLWGGVAEAVQALAASRGKLLSSHRSMHWFIGELSKELNDATIAEAFYAAENLHHNGFHEVELETRDVALVFETVTKLVSKLLGLIPNEILTDSE